MTRLKSIDMNASMTPLHLLSEPQLSRLTAADRFAKHGVVVTELYSWHLPAGDPLPAETWWVRLIPDSRLSAPTWGDEAMRSTDGLGEVHEAPFDPRVVELPDMARRRAVLDFIQTNLVSLAAERGWPRAPLEAAHSACLAEGLRLERVGPVKSSPNRRIRARVRHTIDGDGAGWAVVEFLDRQGLRVRVSEAFDSPCAGHAIRQLTRSLRWEDNDIVSFVPWWEPGERDGQRKMVAALATDR